MIFEGMRSEALGVVETVRSRFDGRRRNPFDEAECGHHYVRAMASWGLVPAWTGFAYDGVDRTLRFAAPDPDDGSSPVRWFWSNGYAWGTVEQRRGETGIDVSVQVIEGTLRVRELALSGMSAVDLGDREVGAGERIEVNVPS
jgi:hypothetical protein